ncbi:DUF481 domain-containing protein [candidate division KSB1 bacterium]|nr:DUF481 domain-containing protein [candidate division KSB1 bacterium]
MKRIIMLFLLLTGLLIYHSDAVSQVNVEKFRKNGHEKGLTGYARISVSSRTGNVDVTEIDVEGSADFRWKRMDSFIIVQGDQGWKEDEQYSNEGLIHFRQIYEFKKAWQPETFIQTDFNKKRSLSDRKLFGIGFRTTIFRNSSNSIVCGTSYMYEYEKLDISNQSVYQTITKYNRWNNYFALNLNINSRLQGYLTTYYQPRFDEFSDMRILSEANLKAVIFSPFSVTITYNMRYDSDPPENIKDMDAKLTMGLVYVF